MACGTGKTLVSLWISEAVNAERPLVLVPSLSLLKQTIRERLINRSGDFEFLPFFRESGKRFPLAHLKTSRPVCMNGSKPLIFLFTSPIGSA